MVVARWFFALKLGSWLVPHMVQVLLRPAVYMNPSETNDSAKKTRVRLFDKKDFAEDVQAQKWDRLRIVCKQPWLKDVRALDTYRVSC